MQLYYSTSIEYHNIRLSPEESRHCVKVMRLKQGDTIYLTDGKGNLYRCIITDADPRGCKLEIQDTQMQPQRPYYLHIAIAPTKNLDRLEWFIEKAVEAGIDRITPIFCERSERRTIKAERLNQIAISAMKQSFKTYQTTIDNPLPYSEVVKQQFEGEKYICHCGPGEKIAPWHPFKPAASLILIGPEGDFTPSEVQLANEQGFRALSLGPSRLRTETAGLAACLAVYFAFC